MTNIKLLAVEKSDKHNSYTFPKVQEFFEVVRDLLKELEFEHYEWNGFGRPRECQYDEPLSDEDEDIKKYTDEMFTYEKEDDYIEIIFGKDKVFLIIHTQKNQQRKISKIIN